MRRTHQPTVRVLLSCVLCWAAACSDIEEGAPLRDLNPAPEVGYIITMTLKDAPGPFASIEGAAQYTVENSAECGKMIPIAGAFPRISTDEPFVLSRVSETEYRGVVYSDLVVNEDYYGRGLCKWEFVEARVRLRATKDETDTRFVPSIAAESIVASGSDTRYFWKERYPRVQDYDAYPEFGDANLDKVPLGRRGEFFTITLAAEGVES